MPAPVDTIRDDALAEYGPRLRISAEARASVLDLERQRLHLDLDALRDRAAGRKS